MNYANRILLTTWRKKTTFLVTTGLLLIIVFGLQYSHTKNEDLPSKEAQTQVLAESSAGNVKFVDSLARRDKGSLTERSQLNNDKTVRDLGRRNQQAGDMDALESDQELGIPFVGLDGKRPYIPKRRIVHFDLKGAPPLIPYLKKVFHLIKNMGATGILLEYEDMFPFKGILKQISAKNAYTPDQVKEILTLAEDFKLDVIPLIQTFGHVEFALKHPQWSHLREVEGSPQALCPSRNSSLDFIRELVSQVMEMHPNAKFLHIGCDEVFQMGECQLCRMELHENLFLKHVVNVVRIVRERYPNLRIIIWDDMLRHLSLHKMLDVNLGDLVEPMVWVYAEDIYRFMQPPTWDMYAAVFRTAWAASAFKGAFGETLYIPNVRRHLENNLRWLNVMAQQASAFKDGFSGIVLTGWQRYDHFAVLCELLPAAIPSLSINLMAVTNGFFNSSLREKFLIQLSCPTENRNVPFINLDQDPFLWEKLNRCLFPGSQFFRLTFRLHAIENEARIYIDLVRNQKGWMTDYNIRRNYTLPLRVDELMLEFPRVYHGLISLAKSSVDAMRSFFDNYTITEWIEQRIYPYIIELELIQNQSIALKSVNQWPARPLPPLKDLQRLGISVN